MVGYLIVQAVAVALWWGLLTTTPEAIAWFHPKQWPAESLKSFWLADLTLLAGGSFVTALAIARRASWAATAIERVLDSPRLVVLEFRPLASSFHP